MATVIKDIQEESDKITKVRRIIKNRSEKLEKRIYFPLPYLQMFLGKNSRFHILKIRFVLALYFQGLAHLNMPSSG